jgi:hypothetical protein
MLPIGHAPLQHADNVTLNTVTGAVFLHLHQTVTGVSSLLQCYHFNEEWNNCSDNAHVQMICSG